MKYDPFEPKLPPINLLAMAPAWIFYQKRGEIMSELKQEMQRWLNLHPQQEYSAMELVDIAYKHRESDWLQFCAKFLPLVVEQLCKPITPADVPEAVRKMIVAEALEGIVSRMQAKWETEYNKGTVRPTPAMTTHDLKEEAAKLRKEAEDETVPIRGRR